MITPDKIQALKRQQDTLSAVYRAWMNEKRKYAAVSVADKDGNIVELLPNGSERIVWYADNQT